jgi:predicted DsbA family dithiol-disulfide isomerase
MGRSIIGFAGIALMLAAAVVIAEESSPNQPFPGRYRLVGDAARLLAGDKIAIEMFASPGCAQCFLFHREMKKSNRALGDDVSVSRVYVFHPDGGQAPVRLLLTARLAKPEREDQALAALFDAAFERKVSIEDDEVLAALAAAQGLGEAWKDAKLQTRVAAEMARLERRFAEMGGAPKTPLIVINGAVAVSPGYSKAQGDELPAILFATLDAVRVYRKAHGR